MHDHHHGFSTTLSLLIQGSILLTTYITEALDLKLSVIGHLISITASIVTLALAFILNRKKIKARLREWIDEYKKPPIL